MDRGASSLDGWPYWQLHWRSDGHTDNNHYIHADTIKPVWRRCPRLGYGHGKRAADLYAGGLAVHHQPWRIDNTDRELFARGDFLYLEQQQRVGVLGVERERFALDRCYVYGDRNQCFGQQYGGIGDGDGEPAADLHLDTVALDDQPGRIDDTDGQLHSRCDFVHLERQQRAGVFGVERQRFADRRRDVHGHRHECCGFRRCGLRDRDRHPAAHLHAVGLALNNQQGGIDDTNRKLHSGCDVLHLERQRRVGVVGFERQCFPDRRRDLHRNRHQRRRNRRTRIGERNRKPAAHLHPVGLACNDQPGRFLNFDGQLFSGSNILHLEQ